MRKLWALILAGALMLPLAACGGRAERRPRLRGTSGQRYGQSR